MTVRIEAGPISQIGNLFERGFEISDTCGISIKFVERSLNREELEIIDHENFMKV